MYKQLQNVFCVFIICVKKFKLAQRLYRCFVAPITKSGSGGYYFLTKLVIKIT